MAWIAFLITLPIPFFAATLLKRIYEEPEQALEYLALSHGDVRTAMLLLMAGFLAEAGVIINSTMTEGTNLLVGSLAGTFVTLTMTTALLILNIAAREREKWYYRLLPTQVKNRFKE